MKALLGTLACLLTCNLIAQSNDRQSFSEELKPFEFTLGKWEFTWHHFDPQTKKRVDDGKAYSSVSLIHDGMTYADEFYKKNADGSIVRGTTFRGYDPLSQKLKMIWVVAGSLSYNAITGSKEDDNLVFYFDRKSSDKHGTYQIRITFYDIKEDSYNWKQDYLYDDGTVIEMTTFYEAKRVN